MRAPLFSRIISFVFQTVKVVDLKELYFFFAYTRHTVRDSMSSKQLKKKKKTVVKVEKINNVFRNMQRKRFGFVMSLIFYVGQT